MPGANWTAGSAVPPFRTIFFCGVVVEVFAAVFRWRRFLAGAWAGDAGFFAASPEFDFCVSGAGGGAGADWVAAGCAVSAGELLCPESGGELDGVVTGGCVSWLSCGGRTEKTVGAIEGVSNAKNPRMAARYVLIVNLDATNQTSRLPGILSLNLCSGLSRHLNSSDFNSVSGTSALASSGCFLQSI